MVIVCKLGKGSLMVLCDQLSFVDKEAFGWVCVSVLSSYPLFSLTFSP